MIRVIERRADALTCKPGPGNPAIRAITVIGPFRGPLTLSLTGWLFGLSPVISFVDQAFGRYKNSFTETALRGRLSNPK
jgi:hypothetical protein